MTTSVATDAGFISTVAGTGVAGYNGDGDSAEDARLYYPTGVAVNSAGTIFIADSYNRRVRSIEKDGVIRTVAGNGTAGSGGTGQATSAPMYPTEVVADDSGNLYVIDLDSQRVRLIKSDGVIVTVAGNGTAGYSGDGGHATGAQLYMQEASGVAVDGDGNLYIGDRFNHRVRMVKKDGTIKTLAGTGTAGFSGDGGRAAAAQVSHPCGVAVDGDGNVYFADHFNHRIRMVTRSGNIKTVAGTGSGGYSGDGQATSVQLNYPTGIAVDAKGNLYIADLGGQRIRKVSNGVMRTIAGTGSYGFGGDGDAATAAQIYNPLAVDVDGDGNVYFVDNLNHRVRKISHISEGRPVSKRTNLTGNWVAPTKPVQSPGQFDIGATVVNRGPGVASGDITVSVELPEPLAGGVDRTSTAKDVTIQPNGPGMPVVFTVNVPEGVPEKIYTGTIRITYAGETEPADNTKQVEIAIVKPAPTADEKALKVRQSAIPSGDRNGLVTFSVEFTADPKQPVSPGLIQHVFTAPTDFKWTGQAYYFYITQSGISDDEELIASADSTGKKLKVYHDPHVNTSPSDTGKLVYRLYATVRPNAKSGIKADGDAQVGELRPTTKLVGKVN